MMTLRRKVTCVLFFFLLVPMAQAGPLPGGEPLAWLPQWLVDFAEWICASLGAEDPTNTSQDAVPYAVPTG